jgi:hypothetical protein
MSAEASVQVSEALMAELEEALVVSDTISFQAYEDVLPKPCVYKIISSAYQTTADKKKVFSGKIFALNGAKCKLLSNKGIIKGQEVELTIFFEKDYTGETIYTGRGAAQHSKKISGGYDVEIELNILEKNFIPIHKRFYEFVTNGDFAGWNRWTFDIDKGPKLKNLDLEGSDMRNFNLCAADFSGSNLNNTSLINCNLSGANFEKCQMDNILVSGADLFRCKIPRKYMEIISACELVEVESIVFI